jgi:ABC-type multidrug transport system ATPase subunit
MILVGPLYPIPIVEMLIIPVRGVSGGERKRVSIAEAALGGSPLQCWDNSTRGLDSATALEFVKSLRLSADLTGATCVVAIYQASQSMYNVNRSSLILDHANPLRYSIKFHFFTRVDRFISVTRTPQNPFSSRWALYVRSGRQQLISLPR